MTQVHTPLCRELGIEYPIFNVGFGEAAGPELAAAVSNAGGCGVIGASAMPIAEIERRIVRTRELTERPFGVNVIIAALERSDADPEFKTRARARIATAIEARAPVLVLFWGDPAPFVEDAHQNGVKLFVQIGSLREAEAAAAAGVDAVIAQGLQAGGHVRGTVSIWELLPQVVPAIEPVPVLASGGIGDGSAIARALELGAQGVSLGTRFVACEEAWTPALYKQRVVESGADDTFYGYLYDIGFPDAPHRSLRNKTFEEWDAAGRPPPGERPGEGTSIGTYHMPGDEPRPWMRYASGMINPDFDGDLDYAPMWAGESCTVVNDVKPAAQIVQDLVAEAEATL